MGFLPGFKNDLFVSYAHIDNQPVVGQELGWVTVLKDNLKSQINRRLATESKIWMDQQLVSQARFSTPIIDALKQSAGLLVIASPTYLKSYWCGRERGGFLDVLKDHRVAQRPIFIVTIDDLSLPEEFGDCLPVKFWQCETDGAAPQRLGDPLPALDDPNYWKRLNDLSFKIAEELRRFKSVQEGHILPKNNSQAIFLAEVTDDLMDDCDRVKRSLEQAGILVLPDRAYPRDTPEAFVGAMQEDLGRCKAFVQLLGEYPGQVRGWNRSMAALQYETSLRPGIRVLQHRRFKLDPEAVKKDDHRALVFGPTVVNVDLEEFIRDVVNVAKQDKEVIAPRDSGELLVFVDNDADDAKTAADLCQFFDKQGIGYMTPSQSETAEEMRAELEENLTLCDGLVLIYGRTQASWVRHQLKEAIKIKGVRNRPLKHVVLCHAEPEDDKADPGIKLPNQLVVDCRHGLDARAQKELTDFVKLLREAAQ